MSDPEQDAERPPKDPGAASMQDHDGITAGAEPEEERSLFDMIAAIVADVPDEEWEKFPTDASSRLDHYLRVKKWGTQT